MPWQIVVQERPRRAEEDVKDDERAKHNSWEEHHLAEADGNVGGHVDGLKKHSER